MNRFPIFDRQALLASAANDLRSGLFSPAAALALACLTPIETHQIDDMSPDNLMWFKFGYRNPLEALICASTCLPVPEKDRRAMFFSIAQPPQNQHQKDIQAFLLENLRALINLYKRDRSGAQIFGFLCDYPFSRLPSFSSGMDVSATIYWNLAPNFAKLTPNDDWLSRPDEPNSDQLLLSFGQPLNPTNLG